MDALRLSAKHAVRSLWHDKTFASTVLLTFAVCIAANAALFAIVNSVVLRPLPIADAHSILLMSNEYPKAGAFNTNNSSSGDYFDRMVNEFKAPPKPSANLVMGVLSSNRSTASRPPDVA